MSCIPDKLGHNVFRLLTRIPVTFCLAFSGFFEKLVPSLYPFQDFGVVSPNPGPGGTRPNTNLSQGPRFPFKAKGLRCCHLNVRSLPVHLDEVGTLILLNNLDVFAVGETWLNSTWNDHELNIQGYQLFRQDRETTVAS